MELLTKILMETLLKEDSKVMLTYVPEDHKAEIRLIYPKNPKEKYPEVLDETLLDLAQVQAGVSPTLREAYQSRLEIARKESDYLKKRMLLIEADNLQEQERHILEERGIHLSLVDDLEPEDEGISPMEATELERNLEQLAGPEAQEPDWDHGLNSNRY